jgi:hypothetical protein
MAGDMTALVKAALIGELEGLRKEVGDVAGPLKTTSNSGPSRWNRVTRSATSCCT